MKKKILISLLSLSTLALASCTNVTTKTTTTKVDTTTNAATTTTSAETSTEVVTTTEEATNIKYTVTVTDIDGEVLIDNVELSSTKGAKSILTDLAAAGYDVETYETSYGTSISSIEGSIVDSNYYLAFNINGEYGLVGAADYELQDGDAITFTNTCWKSFDEYDLLVDKTLYHYSKNVLKDVFTEATTYESTSYWDNMISYTMLNNGYDTTLYSGFEFSEDYISSVQNADVDTLSGPSIGKWFYAARTLGANMTDFKESYKTYLSGLTEYGSEYVMPFTLSPAKYLELEDSIPTDVKNTAYRAGTSWGLDGICWQIASLSLYQELSESELTAFAINDQGNAVSTALELMPFAALNKNVRSYENSDNKDLIEILFDNYYDSESQYILYNSNAKEIDNFTNQIYAALASYKVQRDLQIASCIFE